MEVFSHRRVILAGMRRARPFAGERLALVGVGRSRCPSSPRVRHLCSSRPPDVPLSTVLDILKYATPAPVQYIEQTRRVSEAMHMMLNRKAGSLVVKDDSERIVGFLTVRDLMRCVVSGAGDPSSVLFDPAAEPRGWNSSVRDIMTSSKELVFLTPKDSLEDARALMSVSGKRHIPVLSGSALLGVISPRDIARSLHLQRPEVREQTAKTSYVSTVMPRKGMPRSMRAKEDADDGGHRLALRSAVCNLPHPHKQSLGEDAFLLGPHMVGVADGVGSWWELDVDPAEYARGLMAASLRSCTALKAHKGLRPQAVLHEAWHKMQHVGTVGSSTACLVSLHHHKEELLAANVGDSGFLILRRNETLGSSGRGGGGGGGSLAVSGTLDAYAGSAGSGGSHHVAFRSPQQLRAFNAPFQLGRAPDVAAGEPDDRFETPHDAALVRVPIRGGDVIVLATDGLFDNMPESAVLDVFDEHGEAAEEELARQLATRAQELSLDKTVDSPFATLAKENDILWGGGRPDDITIIVSSVVDTSAASAPPPFEAFTGPGPTPSWVDQEPAQQPEGSSVGYEEWH